MLGCTLVCASLFERGFGFIGGSASCLGHLGCVTYPVCVHLFVQGLVASCGIRQRRYCGGTKGFSFPTRDQVLSDDVCVQVKASEDGYRERCLIRTCAVACLPVSLSSVECLYAVVEDAYAALGTETLAACPNEARRQRLDSAQERFQRRSKANNGCCRTFADIRRIRAW